MTVARLAGGDRLRQGRTCPGYSEGQSARRLFVRVTLGSIRTAPLWFRAATPASGRVGAIAFGSDGLSLRALDEAR